MITVLSVAAADFRLSTLVDAVSSLADERGWDADLTMRVNLILEELCLNVRSYGEIEGRSVVIKVSCVSREVRILFIDGGAPFDPLTQSPEPDLTSPLGRRRLGGLGLHLVRSLSDHVSYSRLDGLNQLDILLTWDAPVAV